MMELSLLHGGLHASAIATLCTTLFELHKGDLMLSDTEFSVMECYMDVMKPLLEVTRATEGEKWVVNILIIQSLLHKLLNE